VRPDQPIRIPILRALTAKVKTAPTVTDWEVLRALGLDEMGCLEVAHIVGIFNYLTRLADGFGLALHPTLMEAARSGIPLRRVGG
jgi:hypothetical protein